MLVLSLSLSLSLYLPPRYVCLSVVRSAVLHLDLDFTTKAAHLSFSSPLFSSLPCFALSPLGWFLHQPRQELILEFCPWFPPISPRAVTCQCCPPLGSPSCCNYLWHPGSGAFHTGDMVEGGVGTEGWKEEREVLSVQPTERCQRCCWSACYCRNLDTTIQPPLYPTKSTLLTLKTTTVTFTHCIKCTLSLLTKFMVLVHI